MKKFLLSFVLFALVGFASKSFAQSCAVTNVVISGISTATVNGKCEVTFNLQYDFSYNNGTKFAGVLIYQPVVSTSTLTSLGAYGNVREPNKFPTAAEINAFGPSSTGANILKVYQIAFDSTSNKTLTTYKNGQNTVGSPTSFQPQQPYTRTSIGSFQDRFTFTGIKLTVPTCDQVVTLKVDVVGTNDANFQNAQCAPVTSSFVPNAPVLSGVVGCGNPRFFSFNVRVPEAATVTFTAYNAATMQILTSPTNVPYQNIAVQAVGGNVLNVYGPYEFESAKLSKFDVYLDIKVSNVPNNNSLTITNTCAPLPVTLKSFEARRTSKEKVALNWITSSESNNSGFDVQRKDGNGEWKTVSFVMSQARNGNSDNNLSYQYIDNNSTSGISQYRLRQVDIDRRATLSEVRSVRGEEMAGNKVNVFPNPSQDGKVNLLFEDKNTSRNITVSDMTGRIIKQYRAIRDNSLTIEGLENGMYNIHITDMSTSATNVEKVIIKKR